MIYTFTFWQRFWHRRRWKQLRSSLRHSAHKVLELSEQPTGDIILKLCSESYYLSRFLGKGTLRVGLMVADISTWRCGKAELKPAVVEKNNMHLEGSSLVFQFNYAGQGFVLRCRQLEQLSDGCYCIDEQTGEAEPYEEAIKKMEENSGVLMQLLKKAGAKKQGAE